MAVGHDLLSLLTNSGGITDWVRRLCQEEDWGGLCGAGTQVKGRFHEQCMIEAIDRYAGMTEMYIRGHWHWALALRGVGVI